MTALSNKRTRIPLADTPVHAAQTHSQSRPFAGTLIPLAAPPGLAGPAVR
ncbi:MAG: hypothetical protein OXH20_01945 [bacterium]|nr:hypothetical protein [bacterium]MDE0667520.1 hypothetical protein [bacterium]